LSQETIARILSIEREATSIHDDAQRQAARMIKDAEKAATALREQILTQAHQQAEQIVATGREAAEAERARIIAQAEAEAQRMETLAASHFDEAVKFVLAQVAGHK
jgi:vacuolar-type H+-ATPase subunit H